MMSALASETSKVSFEGRLLHTELEHLEGVTHEETEVLKRATLQPRFDFLALPLTQGTLPAIKKAIISKIGFGHNGIVHVQIARDGKMAFAAYDSFDKECVVAYSAVPSALLDKLTGKHVLRSYQRAPQPTS
jgi:hypothetical protein